MRMRQIDIEKFESCHPERGSCSCAKDLTKDTKTHRGILRAKARAALRMTALRNTLWMTALRKPCIYICYLLPSLSFAFMCPTNFNQINFGMMPPEVLQICGKPDSQNEYVKPNDNVPQEWTYYIPQTVYLGGSNPMAQGTLKTSVAFDDKGKAVNISVNGIGVGQTTICNGTTVSLGDDKERIKSACGSPGFINKQSPTANPNVPQDTKILEFNYKSVNPPVKLIFENGRLTDKQ